METVLKICKLFTGQNAAQVTHFLQFLPVKVEVKFSSWAKIVKGSGNPIQLFNLKRSSKMEKGNWVWEGRKGRWRVTGYTHLLLLVPRWCLQECVKIS